MDIYHLRYFLAVADRLSFTRAAEDLLMATSPLSRRIRDLEHQLGVDLFERSPRRVVLTPAGVKLVPLARQVVIAFDSLRAEIAPTWHDEIAVGVASTTPPDLIKIVEATLIGGSPERRVRFDCAAYPALTKLLHAGELDLAFQFGPVHLPGSDMEGIPLRAWHLSILMAERDPRASLPAVGFADFTRDVFVDLRGEQIPFDTQRAIDRLCDEHRLIRGEPAQDLLTLAYEVASGRVCALLWMDQESPAARVMESMGVVSRAIEGYDERFFTWIAWSTQRPPGDAEELRRALAAGAI